MRGGRAGPPASADPADRLRGGGPGRVARLSATGGRRRDEHGARSGVAARGGGGGRRARRSRDVDRPGRGLRTEAGSPGRRDGCRRDRPGGHDHDAGRRGRGGRPCPRSGGRSGLAHGQRSGPRPARDGLRRAGSRGLVRGRGRSGGSSDDPVADQPRLDTCRRRRRALRARRAGDGPWRHRGPRATAQAEGPTARRAGPGNDPDGRARHRPGGAGVLGDGGREHPRAHPAGGGLRPPGSATDGDTRGAGDPRRYLGQATSPGPGARRRRRDRRPHDRDRGRHLRPRHGGRARDPRRRGRTG